MKQIITFAANAVATTYTNNKQVIFKNYVPFTDCINEIKNTQVDNTKDVDIVMPIYNLWEYSNNCSGKIYSNIAEINQIILQQIQIQFKFKSKHSSNTNITGNSYTAVPFK